MFETCGPAKPADISLNIWSIFVRARVGEPIVFLIPKHLSDVRHNRAGTALVLMIDIGELPFVVHDETGGLF